MVLISHLFLFVVLNAFLIINVNAYLPRDLDDDESNFAEQKRSLCSLCDIKSVLHGLELIMAPSKFIVRDCADLRKKGFTADGVYQINPDGHESFSVRCDMTTNGGGWTIFQRRIDGSEYFYRGWQDYKRGFGCMKKEFWLGLDKIHQLTSSSKNILRVDMEDTTGATAYATYSSFAVSDENSKYKLKLGAYSGTAGNSLSGYNNNPFSTKDVDNDKYSGNCAVQFKGAWWYTNCHSSNLNGHYYLGTHTSYADGVNWNSWKGFHYSLKKTEMKIRPIYF